jgi:hypothetical protein
MEAASEATPGHAEPNNRRRRWTGPKSVLILLVSAIVAGAVAFGFYSYVSNDSVFVKNASAGDIIVRHCGSKDSRVIRAERTIEFGLATLHACPVYDAVRSLGTYLGCLPFPATLPGGGQVTYPADLMPGTAEASCQ